MEVIVNSGSYRYRAVLVAPEQPKGWLCQEYVNVGFETEGLANKWVDSTDAVALNVAILLAEENDGQLRIP